MKINIVLVLLALALSVPVSASAQTKQTNQQAGGTVAAHRRDIHRLSAVQALTKALKKYQRKNNSYPSALSTLVPKYLTRVPAAPTPADGTCTAAQNTYAYTQKGPNSFALTFCLGSQTGTQAAGTHTVSPAGIQ